MTAADVPASVTVEEYADFIVTALDGSDHWTWDDVGLDAFRKVLDTIDTALEARDAGRMSAAFHTLVRLGDARRRIPAQPTGDGKEEHSGAPAGYPGERVNVIVDRLCAVSAGRVGPDERRRPGQR